MNERNPIRWENPPSETTRRKLTADHPFVVELKNNPGRWARFADFDNHDTAKSVAGRIKRGESLWNQPAGSFDAAYSRDGSKMVVYARYVGDDGPQEQPRTFDQLMADVHEVVGEDGRLLVEWTDEDANPSTTAISVMVCIGSVCEYATRETASEAVEAALAKLRNYLAESAS